MSQPVEDGMSVDNHHFAEVNKLGTPLGVYRIEPSLVRLFRRICLATIIMAVLILLSLITLHLVKWYQQNLQGLIPQSQNEQGQTILYLLVVPSLPCLGMILMGGLGLCIVIPQLQSKRIVICEYGLIQVIKKKKSEYREIVRWSDIQLIRKISDWSLTSTFIRRLYSFAGQSYAITYKNSRVFILDGSYQNLDELIFLIRSKAAFSARR